MRYYFSSIGLYTSNIAALFNLSICLICLNTGQGIDNIFSIDKFHDVGNQIGRNHCQCSIEDSQGYFMSNKTVEEALNWKT